MDRQTLEGECQQEKVHLKPYAFGKLLLSPISENRESTVSPHPAVARLESYSLHPDLIIKKQRTYVYEDETEEFYNRLEVRMKRYYRKVFRGEDIDIEDFSDNSVHNNSHNEPEDIEDGNGDIGDERAETDVSGDDDNSTEPIESAENVGSDNSSAEEVNQIFTSKTKIAESQASRDETNGKIFSLSSSKESFSDKENTLILPSQTYTDEMPVTDSETPVITPEKSKTVQKKLAKIKGKIFSLSSSGKSISEKEENIPILPSQTYTEKPDKIISLSSLDESISEKEENEKPDQSEDSSCARSKTISESSGPVYETITERVMIHAEDVEEEYQLELMRGQTTQSLEISFKHPDHSKDVRLGSNIGHSMEEPLVDTSIPMELDAFNQPSRIGSPLQEISPILQSKRPATTDLYDIAAKKKKKDEEKQNVEDDSKEVKRPNVFNVTGAEKKKRVVHEKANEDYKELEIMKKNNKDVATEIEVGSSSIAIQVNISTPISFVNVVTQTDFQEIRETSTDIRTGLVEACIQTDDDSHWVHCRDAATETEERETNDESTQTRRSFEYYRLFDGINFFFNVLS